MTSTPRAMRRPRLARWRDLWIARDPGGFAFRIGLRSLLSLVISGLVLLRANAGATNALLGGFIGMTTCIAIAESNAWGEALTLVVGIAATVAGLAAATLVAASPLASGVVLCAVVFASVLLRTSGQRWNATGLLAFMGVFFALFVNAKASQLGGMTVAIVVAGLVSAAVRFAIVPERTRRVHAHVLRAWQARMQLLLDALDRELALGKGGETRLRLIRRQTGLVNEASLALEEVAGATATQGAPVESRPWLCDVLRAEVALDMLADAVYRISASRWPAERRETVRGLLGAVQRWISSGATARAELEELLSAIEARAHERLADETAEAVWSRADRALRLLLSAEPWRAMPDVGRVTAMSFRAGGGGTAGVTGSWPTLRVAVQATIAVAIATFFGRMISAERWYWAALAAYVIFSRATTFAETLSRAWQRFFGTILGVTAGLLIAELLRQHTTVATIVALAAVFISYAMLRISYVAMVLFVTIALALLYEMMGRPVPGLMALRLEETTTGAVIGVIISATVFPLHSTERVRRLVADVLRASAAVIERVTRPGENGARDDVMHDLVRTVDRALSELRNALRPLWAGQMPFEAKVTRYGRQAALIAYATRRAGVATPARGNATAIASLGSEVADECRRVASALESGERLTVWRIPGGGASGDAAEICVEVHAMLTELALAVNEG